MYSYLAMSFHLFWKSSYLGISEGLLDDLLEHFILLFAPVAGRLGDLTHGKQLKLAILCVLVAEDPRDERPLLVGLSEGGSTKS